MHGRDVAVARDMRVSLMKQVRRKVRAAGTLPLVRYKSGLVAAQ